jgi:hypothetical protein
MSGTDNCKNGRWNAKAQLAAGKSVRAQAPI